MKIKVSSAIIKAIAATTPVNQSDLSRGFISFKDLGSQKQAAAMIPMRFDESASIKPSDYLLSANAIKLLLLLCAKHAQCTSAKKSENTPAPTLEIYYDEWEAILGASQHTARRRLKAAAKELYAFAWRHKGEGKKEGELAAFLGRKAEPIGRHGLSFMLSPLTYEALAKKARVLDMPDDIFSIDTRRPHSLRLAIALCVRWCDRGLHPSHRLAGYDGWVAMKSKTACHAAGIPTEGGSGWRRGGARSESVIGSLHRALSGMGSWCKWAVIDASGQSLSYEDYRGVGVVDFFRNYRVAFTVKEVN
ncbi:MAG: hypothetical protein ACOX8U_11295 [Bradymonadia bacterium]|jgi:hypothetical protein